MNERGQLVVLAAAALAVALVPVLTALMQLGYHPDVDPRAPDARPVEGVDRTLHRALARLGDRVPATFSWAQRGRARAAVRAELGPLRDRLNRSRLAWGTAIAVTLNRSRARGVAGSDCPGGPARQFGRCVAIDGVVLQERSDRTHLVAAAVEVRVTRRSRRTRVGLLLRPADGG